MTRQEMILTLVTEECAETAQRATKAIRFGLNEIQENQDLNNMERLIYEFNDLVAVMELLRDEDIITIPIYDQTAINLKKVKINIYLEISAAYKTLN